VFDVIVLEELRAIKIPLACAAALIAVIGVGATERGPAVEQHLTHDLERSVLVDLPGVSVVVSGRDVSLIGSVESMAERTALRNAAAARWGVRTVDIARLSVVPASNATPAGPAVPGLPGTSSVPTRSFASTTTAPIPTSSTSPLVTTTSTAGVTSTIAPTTSTSTTRTTTSVATTTVPPTTTIGTITFAPPSEIQLSLVQGRLSEIVAADPIIFERNIPALSPSSTTTIDLLAELFRSNANVPVQIQCFTDNRGQPGSNLALSKKRADAIRTALIERGVAASQVTSVGFGEARPIATNATEEGRVQNRRVEIVLLRETVPQ
jgi:outer membrane protein OmpA-like peptidoglycan-associated protein